MPWGWPIWAIGFSAGRPSRELAERSSRCSTRISGRRCRSALPGSAIYKGDADGKLGSKTRDALRNFQVRRGLIPDGYADVAALRELRAAR